jgi:hypothetical protein
MAGAGKKTFTAGETLTASDVNTFLMEQSVMVFGGTAARASAIPTPSEGMTSYRTDTQQIESYDGSAWRGMSGLQLIKKQDIGTAVSSVTVTDAFSATYDAYKIIIAGGVGSTLTTLIMQLSGITTNYYALLNYQVWGSNTVLGVNSTNVTGWSWTGSCSTDSLNMNCDLIAPFLNKKTVFSSNLADNELGGVGGSGRGFINNTSSATGFSVSPASGTMTGGTIYVYGYGE